MTEAEIIQKLLKNRGLTSKKAIADFFHPPHPQSFPSPFSSTPAIKLIKRHINQGHKIMVYGDYDVDGLCSTAILWETLHRDYPNVLPHIPHRQSEGYGLSIAGIDHCLAQGAKLIITVDNGITAVDQVDYCHKHECDILIIDHHEKGPRLPDTQFILHDSSTCAAGLTWFFCRDYLTIEHLTLNIEHLSLVALATICDMVPLLGINRSFVKFGLEELNQTKRSGLIALFKEVDLSVINPYHIGYIIGPRLNAAGRLEHAIDSLRLLCTRDATKAHQLAAHLGEINHSRQQLTENSVAHALSHISLSSLIVSAHESYDEGVIGLVAAKLVEKYYHPAIAISIGEKTSKGSARSIPGFHITDHLRTAEKFLINVGGHSMAAGFTLETARLQEFISAISSPEINVDLLTKKQRIDCEIPLSMIHDSFFTKLKSFEPYGLGNPTPVFISKDVQVSEIRRLGKNNQHLKMKIKNQELGNGLDAIWFNPPLDIKHLTLNIVDLIYQIDENTWNGQTKLQLVVKDIKPSTL